MTYSEQAESLIRVNSFAPCTVVFQGAMGEGKVTGLRASVFVVPAAMRTMVQMDNTATYTAMRRRPPLVAWSIAVRACNGLAYRVFCNDVQAPDLFLDSLELP